MKATHKERPKGKVSGHQGKKGTLTQWDSDGGMKQERQRGSGWGGTICPRTGTTQSLG